MWLVSSMLKVPKPAATPAASWTSAGRIAAAVTLVLGAAASFCSQPSSTFPLAYARAPRGRRGLPCRSPGGGRRRTQIRIRSKLTC